MLLLAFMLTYYAVSSLLAKSIVPMAQRPYEAVVFGATGYTGTYCAEHIVQHLPTDFDWAIAGRSESKLQQLAAELRKLNPDRKPPRIEIATLEQDSLERLANKTKVFISTVGPYHKYGTPAVAACAATGTHYLDVTGETPWVYDIIQKFDKVAKKTGAIMIPQIGVESAPADLLAYGLVQYIRKSFGKPTAEVVQSTHTLNGTASGGTLATVLTIFDTYSLLKLAKSSGRWALSAVTPPKQHFASKSIWERLTGMRTVKGLPGPLTDSIQASADIPLVHRSWSLFDNGKFYGPNFRLSCYMRVKNALSAIAVHYGLALGFLALIFPPVRWMLKRFVYQPGQGPTKQ